MTALFITIQNEINSDVYRPVKGQTESRKFIQRTTIKQ